MVFSWSENYLLFNWAWNPQNYPLPEPAHSILLPHTLLPLHDHFYVISSTLPPTFRVFNPNFLYTFPHLILIYWIIQKILGKSANYKAAHHANGNLFSNPPPKTCLSSNRTPDLFVNLNTPEFHGSCGCVWAFSWSAQSFMRRYVLCDSIRGICGVKEAKLLIMAASCGQTWSNAVLYVPLVASVRTCALIGQWKRQQRHVAVSDAGRPFWRVCCTFPYEEARFCRDNRVSVREDGFPNLNWSCVITSFIVWHMLSL